MGNVLEPRTQDTDVDQAVPVPSLDINQGDVLVSSRAADPRSLKSVFATPGRVTPITAETQGLWLAGVAGSVFKNDNFNVNSTTYAAPGLNERVKVNRRGIYRLAITATSGKKGDYVHYKSGASGAQLFNIDNSRIGYAIGRISQDFSGASANDPQTVELCDHAQEGQSIYHFLENRVLEGCVAQAATQPTSRVCVGKVKQGTVTCNNAVIIQGVLKDGIARNKSLAFGGVASLATSTIRFKWVVARSGGFAVRSCSVSKAALASFTNVGITAQLFKPIAFTAGEIPVALLIQFSKVSLTAAMIKNVRGPSMIPRVGAWGI